jgi:hypothetical protein
MERFRTFGFAGGVVTALVRNNNETATFEKVLNLLPPAQ